VKQTAGRRAAILHEKGIKGGGIGLAWIGAFLLLLAIPLIDASAQGARIGNGPAATPLLKPPNGDGSQVKVTIAMVLLNITDAPLRCFCAPSFSFYVPCQKSEKCR